MKTIIEIVSGIIALIISIVIIVSVVLGIPIFLIFLILRLCNVIAWNWWLVITPILVWIVAIITIVFIKLKDNEGEE